jgi:hypothetical protein
MTFDEIKKITKAHNEVVREKNLLINLQQTSEREEKAQTI